MLMKLKQEKCKNYLRQKINCNIYLYFMGLDKNGGQQNHVQSVLVN